MKKYDVIIVGGGISGAVSTEWYRGDYRRDGPLIGCKR